MRGYRKYPPPLIPLNRGGKRTITEEIIKNKT